MVRYLVYLSYIGTHYRGAQKSIGDKLILDPDCIQGAVECALNTIIPKPSETPSVVLSSRTDAGVHALKSSIHINLVNDKGLIYDPSSITQYLNRYMAKCNHDIRILDCIPVQDTFHARFRAKSRTYMYRFMIPKNSDYHKLPIIERNRTSFYKNNNFDIERLKEGLKYFQGVKNFETFAARAENKYQPNIIYVRKLDQFTIEEASPLLPLDPLSKEFKFYAFTCKARSFLYNQIRRMVGSLCALANDKISIKELREMIEVPSSNSWHNKVTPASPHGLYLMNVEYDEDELENYKINIKEYSQLHKIISLRELK